MENPISALTEQMRLLRMEYEEEKQAFARLTDRIGVTRMQERGNAWYPVSTTKCFHNSLNQRIVEIYRPGLQDPEGADVEEHNFEYGRPVSLFVMEGSDSGSPHHIISGTVSYVDGARMAIAISENSDISLLEGKQAGVMLSFDETTYRAMFDALQRTMRAKGRLGELRDLIYSRRPARELTFSPIEVPYLNRTQETGVNKILRAKDFAILHGPPGTGKTTTLVEAIHETLRRESQVLVCAQSNMAVDWICEKLQERGINVLRLGNPARVNDRMLASTYERRFESHPDYPVLWSLRKAIRELRGARKSSVQWHQKMDRLRSRATELEIRINADIMADARVVASTLVGSEHKMLSGMKFGTLFIDEAAQALEAASWIPIRLADRVILAGDHCQLPPTVKSYDAMRAGLGKSLMERIVENHPEAVTLLTVQYRMNERIMQFPNEWFYHSRIEAAPEVRFRGILDLDTPIEWIDTEEAKCDTPDNSSEEPDNADAYCEAVAGESYGRINRDEAILTLLTLGEYFTRIGKRRILDERIDVGIISPYRAQVRYLRGLLRRTPFFRPYRHLISVNTVDGFQGQERDLIVVSLVRSNDAGQIGFLRDLRRMNVAITRARMKLIIIGHSPTLSRHPFYRSLLAYIRSLDADPDNS